MIDAINSDEKRLSSNPKKTILKIIMKIMMMLIILKILKNINIE